MEDLEARLNAISEARPYDVRWYVRDVRSGTRIHRNGDDVIPSASTRKVSILMTVLRSVADGRLDLEETIPTTEAYREGNFIGAILDMLDPGLELSLRDHLVMMITLSDNVSTGIVADKVGLDEVNQFCQDIGLESTTHRQGVPSNEPGISRTPEEGNTTTANDQGSLLAKILDRSRDDDAASELGCSREHCRLALEILGRQKYRNRLPALLPSGASVAHKTGTVVSAWTERGTPIREGFHDVGIVSQEGNPSYIIAAFTNDVPEQIDGGWPPRAHASGTIAMLNRICWEHFHGDADTISFGDGPYDIS